MGSTTPNTDAEALHAVLTDPKELEKRGLCGPELSAQAKLDYFRGAEDQAQQFVNAARLAREHGVDCAPSVPQNESEWQRLQVRLGNGDFVYIAVAGVTEFDASSPCTALAGMVARRDGTEPGTPEYRFVDKSAALQAELVVQAAADC